MKTSSLLVVGSLLVLAGVARASEPAHRLPLVAKTTSMIDGRVAPGEYAGGFSDAKTGIQVSWEADGENLHVALQSALKGWVAIGFGTGGMRGACMVIAFVDKQGRWIVEEQRGKALYRHSKVEHPTLGAGVAGQIDGKTVMEFSLPLILSNGKTITASEPMPFILACHKSKTKLSKHSKATSASLVLETKTNSK